MRDAVIVDAVRTPIGKRGGGLAGLPPAELSAAVLNELVARTGTDPALVDDVVWGCVETVGEQAYDVGRMAVLCAGWPESVPAVTIDRQCGSSQQAVVFAASGLIAGHYDVVVAGGVESMTRIPMGSSMQVGGNPYASESWVRRYGTTPHQGTGAEMIAATWGFTRSQLDEFSLGSHEKAAAAQDSGAFTGELMTVHSPTGDVRNDEGVRRGGSLESMAGLKSAFVENGLIHAGNSSQIADGAAALLMMTSEKAAQLGLTPLARVHTSSVVGADPIMMLTAPIPATAKALARSGLGIGDIGAFEVNEAFAPVPLAWLQDVGADEKALNPLGGAIALGHPLGGSGARLATTLVHHMVNNGHRFGLQTMCEGGGQANATIFENLQR